MKLYFSSPKRTDIFKLSAFLLLTTSAFATQATEQQVEQQATSKANQAANETVNEATAAKSPNKPLSDEQQANQVLNNLHLYAANADWDKYFGLYTKSAIFIGTDATEYWNMAQFEQYARPTKGWHYTLKERKTVRHENVIVFDELLDSTSYGLSRGTGTLILTKDGWKIAQYHLSFPIPNDLAKNITRLIEAHRKNKDTAQ
ncbi:nuclear transport factor 2 family protein [Shewanella sp. AS1]|uniref:nuclear transport factor 2 family protein n=1 Tax=Shewanella sp. AS1 TaxID=2907626 RepID=UPI001F1F150D|nr:nuclear transport factor 2 family protein [Shewanella sp. AS1]MCE9679214.1 nuclear transport factor 2 family protein [Shewanella sp. AS1]